jgi:hypothetical protein
LQGFSTTHNPSRGGSNPPPAHPLCRRGVAKIDLDHEFPLEPDEGDLVVSVFDVVRSRKLCVLKKATHAVFCDATLFVRCHAPSIS